MTFFGSEIFPTEGLGSSAHCSILYVRSEIFPTEGLGSSAHCSILYVRSEISSELERVRICGCEHLVILSSARPARRKFERMQISLLLLYYQYYNELLKKYF